MYQLRCGDCGKPVSSPVPEDTVVRATLICPECLQLAPDDIANRFFDAIQGALEKKAAAERPETPWAVRCREHGKVCITKQEYEYQMNRPDNLWACPICGDSAAWDDEHFEAHDCQ